MIPLTDQQLAPHLEADIRERHSRATRGPWLRDGRTPDGGELLVALYEAMRPVGTFIAAPGPATEDNIRFTSSAHQDVGRLLAEVDRLRAELASAQHAAFHKAANVLDDIARKQDLFDDEPARGDAEHTRSSARALRIYSNAITAARNEQAAGTHESRIWEDDGEWNVSCQSCPAYCDNVGSEADAEQWAQGHATRCGPACSEQHTYDGCCQQGPTAGQSCPNPPSVCQTRSCTSAAGPAPTTTDPLPVRWDRTVIHPDNPAEDTIVYCLTDDAERRPVALFLDDEHREALGLALVDPNPEN